MHLEFIDLENSVKNVIIETLRMFLKMYDAKGKLLKGITRMCMLIV